ncbi:ABC transporter ATP-binding protein [Pontivivens nitratireducens]|uniref:ABC transporter ATP-binding protein n=1 Tax=Pontivivens nitratireducens TaxID=2758038 RepID=UPI001639A5FE|nr:ABC transporter ATP-binding protein [Pontibrevibacter nitratireducens]
MSHRKERPMENDVPTWALTRRLLGENARQHWVGYMVGFVLLAVSSAMTALVAYVMEDVINNVFIDPQPALVWTVAISVIVIFILRGVTTYAAAIVLARIGNRIVADMQLRMFERTQAQSLSWVDAQDIGDLVVRFQTGVTAVRQAIQVLVQSVGRDLLTMAGLVGIMFYQDPIMAFIALFVAPPAIFVIVTVMRRMTTVARTEFASVGRLIGLVKEVVLGARVIKSFRIEQRLANDMEQVVERVRKLNNKIARLSNATSPIMDMLGGFAFAAIILYGGTQIAAGELDAGSLFSFITAFMLVYEPAKRLGKFNVDYQKHLVGVRMVYDILDTAPDSSERMDGADLKVREGEIVIENARFSYGEQAVLHDLSLTIPARKVTALVGPSGGGKSTVLSLISRLHQAQSGRIAIDDQDVSAVTTDSLRRNVALVGQDAFLFDTTIADNIRMGRPDATDAEVEEAARAANAHDFIMRQNLGYETPVGEGGGRLSGGQRQRISIARAMLKNAPILLLDEPTAALDTMSERKVLEAIERLMHGRTVVVIAHRLSTIRDADVIHVLNEGALVESGDHDALMASGGLYRHLHDTQFRSDA